MFDGCCCKVLVENHLKSGSSCMPCCTKPRARKRYCAIAVAASLSLIVVAQYGVFAEYSALLAQRHYCMFPAELSTTRGSGSCKEAKVAQHSLCESADRQVAHAEPRAIEHLSHRLLSFVLQPLGKQNRQHHFCRTTMDISLVMQRPGVTSAWSCLVAAKIPTSPRELHGSAMSQRWLPQK